MRLIDADALKQTWLFRGDDGKPYRDAIDEQPAIEPKRGEWIAVDSYSAFGGDETVWIAHGNPTAFHYCSNCKEQAYADEFGKEILSDFCPNCGADLRGDKHE